jgi:hypothetical protein
MLLFEFSLTFIVKKVNNSKPFHATFVLCKTSNLALKSKKMHSLLCFAQIIVKFFENFRICPIFAQTLRDLNQETTN